MHSPRKSAQSGGTGMTLERSSNERLYFVCGEQGHHLFSDHRCCSHAKEISSSLLASKLYALSRSGKWVYGRRQVCMDLKLASMNKNEKLDVMVNIYNPKKSVKKLKLPLSPRKPSPIELYIDSLLQNYSVVHSCLRSTEDEQGHDGVVNGGAENDYILDVGESGGEYTDVCVNEEGVLEEHEGDSNEEETTIQQTMPYAEVSALNVEVPALGVDASLQETQVSTTEYVSGSKSSSDQLLDVPDSTQQKQHFEDDAMPGNQHTSPEVTSGHQRNEEDAEQVAASSVSIVAEADATATSVPQILDEREEDEALNDEPLSDVPLDDSEANLIKQGSLKADEDSTENVLAVPDVFPVDAAAVALDAEGEGSISVAEAATTPSPPDTLLPSHMDIHVPHALPPVSSSSPPTEGSLAPPTEVALHWPPLPDVPPSSGRSRPSSRKGVLSSRGSVSSRLALSRPVSSPLSAPQQKPGDFDMLVLTQGLEDKEERLGSVSLPPVLFEEQPNIEESFKQHAQYYTLYQTQIAASVSQAIAKADGLLSGGLQDLDPILIPNLPDLESRPPSREAVLAYAEYLGMNLEEDMDLLHIAEMALQAPLPPEYTVHLDPHGVEYFFNITTRTSSYEHPSDIMHMEMYRIVKARKEALIGSLNTA